jgi:NADH-quinone oxidoreductase subunit K
MILTVQHLLTLAAVLFSLGLFTVLTRQNAIAILMGVELILNAVNLNFVAFERFIHHGIVANIAVLVNILVAACEVAVALAIVITLFRTISSVEVDQTTTMKE